MNRNTPPSTQSPCIGVCKLNQDGLCEGCFRTRAEIGSWMLASDQLKARINADAEKRKQLGQK